MTQMTVLAATPAAIAEAAAALRAGELVAFPTETVYGLGADATNPKAVARIFTAKGRPRFNPLIVHVPDVEALADTARLTPTALRLASAFWPGPMTLVLPLAADATIADLTVAGLTTVAVRVPGHAVAQDLLRACGRPVAAPSANVSGHVSATTAQHVSDDFADAVRIVLDAGPADHGVESTIIDVTGPAPRILRHGAITLEAIQEVTGAEIEDATNLATGKTPTAPGQLTSHYAPRCPVHLGRTTAAPGEALLGFGPAMPPTTAPAENLSEAGDLVEAATNLFAALRRLENTDVTAIAVMPIPDEGLGAAINDRLRRAAAPRPSP